MRPLHFAAALLACPMAAPAMAAPDCDLSTRAVSAQQSYDPFGSSDVLLDVTISVTNGGSKACQARLYVAPVNGLLSLANGGDRLLYRIDGPHGGGHAPNSSGPFVVRPDPGATQSVMVRVIVPAQQVVSRGDYLSDLAVSAIAEGNTALPISGAPLTLRVRVPARVEMSISGTASTSFPAGASPGAAIAFGQAASGKSDRVFVHVWSNGGVSVSLDSANRGKLKLVGTAVDSTIDYAARFDGVPAPLTSRFTVQRTPPQNLTGASYELTVTLGDVRNKFAGVYKDTITVTVDQN